jgi:hypothetical protein
LRERHRAVFVNQFKWRPAIDLSGFKELIEVTSSGKIAFTEAAGNS